MAHSFGMPLANGGNGFLFFPKLAYPGEGSPNRYPITRLLSAHLDAAKSSVGSLSGTLDAHKELSGKCTS
jgi:hypothetical protein